jgi:hypothetical protein
MRALPLPGNAVRATWWLLLLGLLRAAPAPAAEPAPDFDPYLWEAHTPGDLAPAALPLVLELRRRIDAILEAGHLAPLRFSGADQTAEGFYLYTEPGRILATLGHAYPFLAESQQGRVRAYLARELADPRFAPWSAEDTLPPDVGSRREFYPMSRNWQWDWARQRAASRPRVAPLFGLWLCAYRTGDWTIVSNHWPAIREFHRQRAARPDLYGTIGAHLGVARLARVMNDEVTLRLAVDRARAGFSDGLDLERMVSRMRPAYARHYDDLHGRGLGTANWCFLDLAPEVGRFLHDRLREPILARHRALVAAFPHWWVYRPWYATGWTGHESEGLPPEILGMIFPIERWVRRAAPDQLAGYQPQNAAHGVGDCHALESLCLAIGSYGNDRWLDVRSHPGSPIVTLAGHPCQWVHPVAPASP